MRMRRKPWAKPELASSPVYVEKPELFRGVWATSFPRHGPMELELGCGKGTFMAVLALQHPEINYLAVDIKDEVLAVASRNIRAAFAAAGLPMDNVRIAAWDIERIDGMLSGEDRMERIYINFCNPWSKPSYKKHRLTYPRQLEKYKAFLAPGGEIRFKTDDDELFEESLEYFGQAGFAPVYLTRDLHGSDFQENIPTEHEQMFAEQGKAIKFAVFRLKEA